MQQNKHDVATQGRLWRADGRNQPGAPVAALKSEKSQCRAVSYDECSKSCHNTGHCGRQSAISRFV